MATHRIHEFLVAPTMTIRDTMTCIGRNARGIALVVKENSALLGTITDGDIRRALLAGLDLDQHVGKLLEGNHHPLTAPVGTPKAELLHLMNVNSLRHIPLVDDDGRVADLVVLTDLIREYDLPLTAVIMAGGFGRRLRPLTKEVPKPMLKVDGRPLLEHIIGQLRDAGIRKFNITTHYMHDTIENHFGDGNGFGVSINYVREDHPLGTAGALRLLESLNDPVLIINGDILTRVDYRSMLEFHRCHHADMTLAVSQSEVEIPYGVIQTDGVCVTAIEEKPKIRHFVNAGIYLANPEVCRFVPTTRCDMPDLIKALLAAEKRVVSFPVHEYWRDVGRMEDYLRVAMDIKNGAY